MDLGTKNANDLISKDFTTSKKAAESIVNSKDIETFKKLTEKSEFLFDFIKEKMVKNLKNALNENNYKNLLAFMPYYSADFEEFVVQGLVKFATEDLTDDILNIFENGTDEEKAYCAAYFEHIKDPLCIELLNKYALSSFAPLAQNCARALFGFNERTLYGEMLEKLKKDDELESLAALNFLTSYGDKKVFDDILEYMKKSSTPSLVAANLLSLKAFEDIEDGVAVEILDNILGGYPEILTLSTLFDFGIYEYLKKLIDNPKDSYRERVVLKARLVFDLMAQNDIYTFDLDKNTKGLIKDFEKLLNTQKVEELSKNLEKELEQKGQRAQEALHIIEEYGLKQFAPSVARLAQQENISPIMLCECAMTLKSLGQIELLDKGELTRHIADENILALLGSYFT